MLFGNYKIPGTIAFSELPSRPGEDDYFFRPKIVSSEKWVGKVRAQIK